MIHPPARRVAGPVTVAVLACARPAPRTIGYGEEACRHCHMTIADPQFAAVSDELPAGGHGG